MTNQNFTPEIDDKNMTSFRYYASLSNDGTNAIGSFCDAGQIIKGKIRHDIIPVSLTVYNRFRNIPWLFYENENFVQHPPPAPSLDEQAKNALTSAKNYIYQNYGILNEKTPNTWVDYLKTLIAITNGTDTTTKKLPIPPPITLYNSQ